MWTFCGRCARRWQASDAATGRPLGEMPVFSRHDRRIGKRIVPLSVRALEDTIKAIVVRAGLAEAGITPHSLRHYFATRVYAALANDAPITAFRAAFCIPALQAPSQPVTTRPQAFCF